MPISHSLFTRYRAEAKKLLILSLPIIGAQMAAAGMTFVDVSMAGQYSSLDLAAVAIGSSIWGPVYYLIRGVLMSITPIVAQQFGAQDYRGIRHKTRQGIWVTIIMMFLGLAVVMSPGAVLDLLNVNPDISALAQQYLHALAFGIPGMCLYQLMASYCEGLSDTRAPMFAGIAALLVNIPANYVLIYGKFGLPALGGVGCGYATAICFTLMTVIMFIYIRNSPRHERTSPFNRYEGPVWSDIREHLTLGLPVGAGLFIETTIFAVIALLIGKLGVEVVAGHQVALNVASLVYIIPVSLGAGVTILVGQHLGAEKPVEASFSSFTGIFTAIVCGTLMAVCIVSFSEQIAGLYSRDSGVIHLAAQLMWFAAAYQISDSIHLVAVGALRGYKDTRVPMFVLMFACWVIALPLGYTLGLTDTFVGAMGPYGFWIGLITALTMSAALNFWRLWKISRRWVRTGDKVQQPYAGAEPVGQAA
ncbi:MATE family efflux transporter [Sansalvadorimonas verongulae]|uniref:MATE family efflux transporter n=1 Tax=Sansalvadorimonas verongulae TaxID=2172824 RepID=UPI0012BC0873|nr:MATE family efflux transporter [Sansalvadorimonas verongulae]MTI13967.1 MATE family efflux transporter [Sansalvadorimonas verongulae]